MTKIEPDGAIVLTAGSFELIYMDDTPEHVEVVKRTSDNEDYWDSFEVSQLREFLQMIDERNEK